MSLAPGVLIEARASNASFSSTQAFRYLSLHLSTRERDFTRNPVIVAQFEHCPTNFDLYFYITFLTGLCCFCFYMPFDINLMD